MVSSMSVELNLLCAKGTCVLNRCQAPAEEVILNLQLYQEYVCRRVFTL